MPDLTTCKNRCLHVRLDQGCGSQHNGWGCTLPKDHNGPHIACGGGGTMKFYPQNHNFACWTDEEAEPSMKVEDEEI